MSDQFTHEAALGLSATVLDQLRAEFIRIPQLLSARVFGSRAKGTYQPGSDIDLALFGPELTPQNLLTLATRLDDLLLPCKIDLCHVDALKNDALLEHIERVGQQIYRR